MIDYTAKDIGMIGNFRFWCQKILPAVYDDSLSYYELLAKVVQKLNEVIDELNIHSEALIEFKALLDEFQAELDAFKEHGFDDYYKEQVTKWIDEHMRYIIEHVITALFFGLTDDGYFCAWIPASWNVVSFDTDVNYSSENYGRLILKY